MKGTLLQSDFATRIVSWAQRMVEGFTFRRSLKRVPTDLLADVIPDQDVIDKEKTLRRNEFARATWITYSVPDWRSH